MARLRVAASLEACIAGADAAAHFDGGGPGNSSPGSLERRNNPTL